ncbi:MAG: hemerythrin domain-containing protein [Geobacteraceae bacterium]|nr:MAG: hemerythrin domain-containing protein [Geobacteraceae bacterium]
MNEFFQMLKKDHKVVKGILGQLEETGDKSKERDELFQKLKEELVPHMKAEEIAFYQPLLAKKEAREVALEGVEEHHVSEMVFKELEVMPKDQDQWAAKLSVFKELLEHHIKEEEGAIFKTAEEVLSRTKYQSILKQFVEEKQKFKESLK